MTIGDAAEGMGTLRYRCSGPTIGPVLLAEMYRPVGAAAGSGPARPGVVGLSRLTSGYLSVELRVQGATELLSGRPGFRSVGQVGVVD